MKEKKKGFSSYDRKCLLWEHTKMLLDKAKDMSEANELRDVTAAICNAYETLENLTVIGGDMHGTENA